MITAPAVEQRLGVQYDGCTDLSQCITAAEEMLEWLKECAASKDVTLTDKQLETIGVNLACHYYDQQDQFLASENTGAAGGSFQGQTAMYFEATKYGQTAVIWDVSGCLAELQKDTEEGNKAKAKVVWLGTPSSEQDARRYY